MYKAEKESYDDRVDVYFQTKAWADRSFSLAWANNTLKNHISERTLREGSQPTTLLFCDNLDSQVHSNFLDVIKSMGASRHLLVAGLIQCM